MAEADEAAKLRSELDLIRQLTISEAVAITRDAGFSGGQSSKRVKNIRKHADIHDTLQLWYEVRQTVHDRVRVSQDVALINEAG